jgi:hypothetical protein
MSASLPAPSYHRPFAIEMAKNSKKGVGIFSIEMAIHFTEEMKRPQNHHVWLRTRLTS